ncbi:hypothetical protein BAJUN_02750 [Bajunvirus bajun]|uniref:Tail assembly chaperone n=1 Tax=Brevundimonas phage vB_BgoS-Bajun TaxID=2948594 RepID=A0A9E7N7X1_9CAUD|nr:hypothetical protein BAJUN_02750 [Brevundimonas phage vB_BgoS-Bajun]
MSTDALDLFELFSADKESEEEGRWVDLNDVTGFKIRAFGAKQVIDLREKLMRPYANLQRANLPIPADKNEEVGLRVIAGAVLADWKGVKIDGELVEYTPENAYKLLKSLNRLANFIISASMDSQNFRDDLRTDGAGNS